MSDTANGGHERRFQQDVGSATRGRHLASKHAHRCVVVGFVLDAAVRSLQVLVGTVCTIRGGGKEGGAADRSVRILPWSADGRRPWFDGQQE